MKRETVDVFVEATREVLQTELGCAVEHCEPYPCDKLYRVQDVTVLVGISGFMEGVVLLGTTLEVASAMASCMLGQPIAELDDVVYSAIAELGNVITGCASTKLAAMGHPMNISAPVTVQGSGSAINTFEIPRTGLAFLTPYGLLELQIALKQPRIVTGHRLTFSGTMLPV